MGNALFVAGLYLDSRPLQLVYFKRHSEMNKLSLRGKLIFDANNKDFIADNRVEPPDKWTGSKYLPLLVVWCCMKAR